MIDSKLVGKKNYIYFGHLNKLDCWIKANGFKNKKIKAYENHLKLVLRNRATQVNINKYLKKKKRYTMEQNISVHKLF